MSEFHCVMQAKGGIGKSLVASWFAQYLRSRTDLLADEEKAVVPKVHWNTADPNPPQSLQCEEQDSNLHALRALEPKRTPKVLESLNLLEKEASGGVPKGSEKTHSGQDVPDGDGVATMADVRACARELVQRVAEGGEIPIASLRELGDLVLRSELIAVSHQLLEGPPEFALRRAMELAGLILAAVARNDREEELEATK